MVDISVKFRASTFFFDAEQQESLADRLLPSLASAPAFI